MKYSKLLIAFIVTSAIFFSCGNSGDEHISAPESSEIAQEGQTANQSSTAKPHEGNTIDAEMFKREIFDYSANMTWNYKHGKACVIDFYADWCRPCKMLAPELAAAVAATNGGVDLYKVNVDQEKELASFFNIQSIPTMLFCPADGSKPFVLQGLVSRDELNNAIGKVLSTPNTK